MKAAPSAVVRVIQITQLSPSAANKVPAAPAPSTAYCRRCSCASSVTVLRR